MEEETSGDCSDDWSSSCEAACLMSGMGDCFTGVNGGVLGGLFVSSVNCGDPE